MSVTPTLKVEVAFDDAWDGVEPITWTDITSYVRAGSIRQGRTNELEQISAGILNLTLDNRDRRFDPFYASGPYYGKLTTRKQIKVTATYSGTDYAMFRGHVSSWPLSPDTSKDMVCQIEAYDLIAYLSTVQLPPDLYTWYIETYNTSTQTWWYPLGGNGQSCGDKWRYGTKTAGLDYTFTTTSPKTSSAPSEWMTGSATQFDGTYGAIGPQLKASNQYTYVSFLVKSTTAGTTGKLNPILASADASPNAFVIGITDGGYLQIAQNTGLGAVDLTTSLPINDGNWHHVAITLDDVTPSFSITVDGYNFGSATGYAGWRGIQLFGMCNDSSIADPYFTGELAHIMVTAGNSGSYEYFRYGYASTDTYQTMVENICNYANLGTYFSTTLSSYPCPEIGGQKWNKSALTALQDITTSVGGRMYVTGAGILTIKPLAAAYVDSTATTVQATFSDSGAVGAVNYSEIAQIVLSDEFLYNQVTVTTADGSTFTANDDTSQTDYGIRSRQLDTSLRNLTDADTLSNQTLTGYGQPIMRFNDWKVIPVGQPSAYPTLLALWLGYRVKVEVIPNNVGTRLSQELLVEQISHDFVPGDWRMTYSGSPARTGWTLEDATYGLLESTTILG